MMKVEAKVEQIVYNHLKKIGEVETIQELMVIKKGNPKKYSNIINSMFREIQQQRAEPRAEPRQQRTEPQRQQRQQRQPRQPRQQGQQRQSANKELTYTEQYLQLKEESKAQIRDSRKKFKYLTSKQVDLEVMVSSELSLNEKKIERRRRVQENCTLIRELRNIELDNAKNILEKYPSAIDEGKKALATIRDDALSKNIEIMEQELADAIKTVAKLDGKLNKMLKTAKVVALYMLTLGKRKRSNAEELMIEIGRIK